MHRIKNERNTRRNSIRELLRKNYTQWEIAQDLNLDQSTISREISSMFRESHIWFGDLAKEAFIHEYHETIKALDHSIKDNYLQIDKLELRIDKLRKLNEEELEGGGDVKTSGTSAQILSNLITIEGTYHAARQNYVKLIDDSRKKRGELLHKGPMMYAIESELKGSKGTAKKPTPQLEALRGDQLNNTDERV